jgi:hypothetical protein
MRTIERLLRVIDRGTDIVDLSLQGRARSSARRCSASWARNWVTIEFAMNAEVIGSECSAWTSTRRVSRIGRTWTVRASHSTSACSSAAASRVPAACAVAAPRTGQVNVEDARNTCSEPCMPSATRSSTSRLRMRSARVSSARFSELAVGFSSTAPVSAERLGVAWIASRAVLW